MKIRFYKYLRRRDYETNKNCRGFGVVKTENESGGNSAFITHC